jgi:hypothetical protein
MHMTSGFLASGRPFGGSVMDDYEASRVRYLCVCPTHGELASALIDTRTPPPDRYCPICLERAEVWVGTTLPARSPAGLRSGTVKYPARHSEMFGASRRAAPRFRVRRSGRSARSGP